MWIVKLLAPMPDKAPYRKDFFPRKLAYKKEAEFLAKEARENNCCVEVIKAEGANQ